MTSFFRKKVKRRKVEFKKYRKNKRREEKMEKGRKREREGWRTEITREKGGGLLLEKH
ncbi:MAG: hypothetical protein ACTSPI_09605 [Candidatus Heimdallarchaeaceae archaeon]